MQADSNPEKKQPVEETAKRPPVAHFPGLIELAQTAGEGLKASVSSFERQAKVLTTVTENALSSTANKLTGYNLFSQKQLEPPSLSTSEPSKPYSTKWYFETAGAAIPLIIGGAIAHEIPGAKKVLLEAEREASLLAKPELKAALDLRPTPIGLNQRDLRFGSPEISAPNVVPLAPSDIVRASGFVRAGEKITVKPGEAIFADHGADVVTPKGSFAFTNDLAERDAKDAFDDHYTVMPREDALARAQSVKNGKLVARKGDVIAAEEGSHIIAQKGSIVFARQGSHVLAEEGSEVRAQHGSEVTAMAGSRVDAYEGSKVLAKNGSEVVGRLQSRIIAEDGSNVRALNASEVIAKSGSKVSTFGSATIHAFEGATIDAQAHAEVHIYGPIKLTTDPQAALFTQNGVNLSAEKGFRVHAEDGSTVIARDGSLVHARAGSQVLAEKGATVYAQQGSQVWAEKGSYVWGNPNSTTYAAEGSTVHAKNGARVFALDGGTVHANKGSLVFAQKGSETFALPGSNIHGAPGAIIHGDPKVSKIFASDADVTSMDAQHIKSPMPRGLGTTEAVAWMSTLSKENRSAVRIFMQDLRFDFGAHSGSNFKELEKIASKAERPSILEAKPWHDVSHIRDAFRFKTVLDDINLLPKIFEKLQKAPDWQIVKVDVDKALNPGEWGWRIIAFDLRMHNGQLVEYYLPVKELEETKKATNHLLFEKWRNKKVSELSADEERERHADMQLSRDNYDTAWRAWMARTHQTDATVRSVLEQIKTMHSQ